MKKNYLFAGASSLVAQNVLAKLDTSDYVIALTTKPELNVVFSETHQVENYSKNSLPDIDMPLDGLIYFSGSINLKPLHRFSEEEIINDFRINALGAVSVVQKYLSNLKARPSAIVLVSSIAANVGMPFHVSISMAKAAIEGLGKSLAAELAPNTRVNVVAPSLTITPLAERLVNSPEKIEASANRHPLKRIGQADDIANAIHFLLTDQSAWITGQVLRVDGGMSSLKV